MIYLTLFTTFFKIGLFTIGGGYAMIPLIQSEMIRHNWLSPNDLVDFIAVSESTPGPFAINISTYIGTETGGFWGAVCATFGVVLPSFIIILLIAKWFMTFQNNRFVQGGLSGLRPAVVGLIASAVFSIGKTNFFTGLQFLSFASFMDSINYIGIFIFIIILILSIKKKPHPIFLILLSAGMGIVFCSLRDMILK